MIHKGLGHFNWGGGSHCDEYEDMNVPMQLYIFLKFCSCCDECSGGGINFYFSSSVMGQN